MYAPNPLWRLFRLGLILWASVTLLRHGFYWMNIVSVGGAFAGGSAVRSMAFAGGECVILIVFLIAAVASPRGTRDRFNILGGLGAAFVLLVLEGALLDMAQAGAGTSAGLLRTLWSFVARIQFTVFPLLCLIGLVSGVGEE